MSDYAVQFAVSVTDEDGDYVLHTDVVATVEGENAAQAALLASTELPTSLTERLGLPPKEMVKAMARRVDALLEQFRKDSA